jgi:TonB family protein
MTKREKKFLKLPHLDGGKDLLKKFIKENLDYPEEALKNNIEGDVIIKYKVTGKGEVINPEIIKGIGYGCDEEALRLVSMLSYQSVKNRGVRVITDNKIKIPFRIKNHFKQQKYSITYSTNKKDDTPKPASDAATKGENENKTKQPEVYTYTISY